MDDADRANALSDIYLTAEIRRAASEARRSGPASQAEPGPRLCAECGEEIPEARIQAVPGCTLCVECQKELEDRP
ncbi:MAG: TraR/DksA C4-type zinc finger protein [Desulfobacteraceae bacterium]|jgi:phage/conjugal plasmid C-4 type zinc finger TraR family protein